MTETKRVEYIIKLEDPNKKPPKKIPKSVTLMQIVLICIILACFGMLGELVYVINSLLTQFTDFPCC